MAPLESLQSELQDVNRKIAQVRGRNMALPKLYKRWVSYSYRDKEQGILDAFLSPP